MLKKLLIAAALFAANVALGDTPSPNLGKISGNDVRLSKQHIDLNGVVKIVTGSSDPTSVAPESCPTGSLYIRTNGTIYAHSDAGSTTNWVLIGSGPSSTDALAEGSTNKYFTEARVRATPATGFTSGAGTVTALDTLLQALQKLDGNVNGKQTSGNYITALTSDVAASGPGSAAATIQPGVVSNSKLAAMANSRFKCRTSSGSGDPEDCTAAQSKALLAISTSDVSGLGTSATHPASDFLQPANNLSDVQTPATARSNLGLGSSATHPTTDFLQPSNNLSDVSNTGTARTNLGLGSSATHATTDFFQLAGISGGQTAICGTGAGDGCAWSTSSNGTKGKFSIGSKFTFDESTSRVGIGTTSPTTRLWVKATNDNYDEFFCTQGTGSTDYFCIYMSPGGKSYFRDGYTGYVFTTMDAQGRLSFGGSDTNSGIANRFKNQSDNAVGDVTVDIDKSTSQTANLFQTRDTDGSTVKDKIDSSFKAWFIGVDAGSQPINNVADPSSAQDAETKAHVAATYVPLAALAWGMVSLSSDFTTTNGTATAVTGMSFSIAANEVWEYYVQLFGGTNGTNGMKIAMSFPSGATNRCWSVQFGTGSTNVQFETNPFSTSDSLSATAVWKLNSVAQGGSFKCAISNGANAGTVQVKVASATGGDTTTVAKLSHISGTRH